MDGARLVFVLAQSVIELPIQVRSRGPVLLPQPPTVSCFTQQREALTPNINRRSEVRTYSLFSPPHHPTSQISTINTLI